MPRMPSIFRPQALPMADKSIAGNLGFMMVVCPMIRSGRVTSLALVASVPLQEVTLMSLREPFANDCTLRIDVAAVSTRNQLCSPPI